MSAEVLVLAGYGLNCEEETLHAFNHVGIEGKIKHINDIIENPQVLNETQILAIPGGFSYGDDTGSGNAFAQKMKLALWENLVSFAERDTLMIGICNGCQIMANLGLIPKVGERTVAVTYNESARYQCRWIDVQANPKNTSPWLEGIKSMHIPVAHGEGRFMMDDETLKALEKNNQIAFRYTKNGTPANGEFPYNPNGSMADIASMTDKTGKILAIMPHPERGMFTWQRDDYDILKDKAQRDSSELPDEADGLQLFRNAARYFEVLPQKARA